MIKETDSITIQYIPSNVIQTKKILEKEKSDLIFSNKKKLISLIMNKDSSASEYEKENLCKFAFDEIAFQSPMYNAIIGKKEGDECIMILPETQGGIHRLKIIKIN